MFFNSCKQENMMFFPEELPKEYTFTFNHPCKEINIKVDENNFIDGLLFQCDSTKGLIFYLHGNAGSLRTWGEIAGIYLDNRYDFFIMDYRGFGKSSGNISSEEQLYHDIQTTYDTLKKGYKEENIIIIGYSIGTGPATWLASKNKPGKLILKAPYYNFPDLVQQHYKIIPSFMVRYKLQTNEYITKVKCPIIIFHGDKDEIINIKSSYKLKPLLKDNDKFIILKNQAHNGINYNVQYLTELKDILE